MTEVFNFNDAQPNTFEPIPDNTQVPVIFHFIHGDAHDEMHATKDGRGRLVKLEAVVTDGPWAKRKLFLNLMMGTSDVEDKGHKQAIDISKGHIRAIIEAARGIDPKDETDAAIAARMATVTELDQMECTIVVGVEKGSGTYSDRNVLKRVVPVGKATPPEGATATAGKSRPAGKPAAAAKQQGAW